MRCGKMGIKEYGSKTVPKFFTNICSHILIRTWWDSWLHIWVMIGVCRLVTTGSPLPFQFPATFVDCLIPDFRSNIIHLSTAWFRKHIIPALHLSTLEAYQWYYHAQTRILAKMDRWCINNILYNSKGVAVYQPGDKGKALLATFALNTVFPSRELL